MLEFRATRRPVDVEELTPLQREQLVVVGRHFDGVDRSADSRLRDEPIPEPEDEDDIDWDDGNLAAHGLVVHEAWENGVHVYDVWCHHGNDNGCVFTAGTTDVIAGRFQDTWMVGDDTSPLDDALQAAEAAAR
ncbi:MAG: hypothetical protein H0T46_08790 [Deltaproteobacteria bacterium]|nr:hypothetical protein [Deltaproteobacteria bacterium]